MGVGVRPSWPWHEAQSIPKSALPAAMLAGLLSDGLGSGPCAARLMYQFFARVATEVSKPQGSAKKEKY